MDFQRILEFSLKKNSYEYLIYLIQYKINNIIGQYQSNFYPFNQPIQFHKGIKIPQNNKNLAAKPKLQIPARPQIIVHIQIYTLIHKQMHKNQKPRLIQQISFILGLPQPAVSTVLQFYNKFNQAVPQGTFANQIVVCACIFLTAKIFQHERKIRDILNAIYVVTRMYRIVREVESEGYVDLRNVYKYAVEKQEGSISPSSLLSTLQPTYPLQTYTELKSQILQVEQHLLKILKFDFSCISELKSSNFKQLLTVCDQLRCKFEVPGALTQIAVDVYNDLEFCGRDELVQWVPGIIYFAVVVWGVHNQEKATRLREEKEKEKQKEKEKEKEKQKEKQKQKEKEKERQSQRLREIQQQNIQKKEKEQEILGLNQAQKDSQIIGQKIQVQIQIQIQPENPNNKPQPPTLRHHAQSHSCSPSKLPRTPPLVSHPSNSSQKQQKKKQDRVQGEQHGSNKNNSSSFPQLSSSCEPEKIEIQWEKLFLVPLKKLQVYSERIAAYYEKLSQEGAEGEEDGH